MIDTMIKVLDRSPAHFCNGCYECPEERAESIKKLAAYLLDEGAIMPPCKVGDTVYYIHEGAKRVYEGEVTSFVYVSESKSFGIHYDGGYGVFGRYVFLTREEAEKALQEIITGE